MAKDDALLLAVGQALKQWSAVEVTLSGLFVILAGIVDQMKAHLIFDTIISFDTRLDVVDALMSEEPFNPLELETWKKCVGKLKKHYRKRHGLAHFSVVDTILQDRTITRLSPFLTYRQFIQDELSYLTEPEIHARRKGFAELVRALMWFQLDAGRRRGLHLDIPMQEPPLIARLRELASQTLEERARKQQETPRT